jgi:hypothetical protein
MNGKHVVVGASLGLCFGAALGTALHNLGCEFVCDRRGDRPWRLTWYGRVVEVRFRRTIRRGIGPQAGDI